MVDYQGSFLIKYMKTDMVVYCNNVLINRSKGKITEYMYINIL
jgi:hypothetical protein